MFFLVRLIRGAPRKTKKESKIERQRFGEGAKKPTGNGISASPADEIHKHSKLNESPPKKKRKDKEESSGEMVQVGGRKQRL